MRCVYSLALQVAGRNEASIQHARSALELFPDSFLGCLLAGWTLGSSGLWDEGAAALQRGLQSLPGNVWLLSALAAIHGRQGQIGEVETSRRSLWARCMQLPEISTWRFGG